jgi:hypothetical protein
MARLDEAAGSDAGDHGGDNEQAQLAHGTVSIPAVTNAYFFFSFDSSAASLSSSMASLIASLAFSP